LTEKGCIHVYQKTMSSSLVFMCRTMTVVIYSERWRSGVSCAHSDCADALLSV